MVTSNTKFSYMLHKNLRTRRIRKTGKCACNRCGINLEVGTEVFRKGARAGGNGKLYCMPCSEVLNL